MRELSSKRKNMGKIMCHRDADGSEVNAMSMSSKSAEEKMVKIIIDVKENKEIVTQMRKEQQNFHKKISKRKSHLEILAIW